MGNFPYEIMPKKTLYNLLRAELVSDILYLGPE